MDRLLVSLQASHNSKLSRTQITVKLGVFMQGLCSSNSLLVVGLVGLPFIMFIDYT